MIRFENEKVVGLEYAIRGMRNPMNSWEKSDTKPCPIRFELTKDNESWRCAGCKNEFIIPSKQECLVVGPNDHKLMMKLAKGGSVHAKYRRMIAVYVDIVAPLYWWKEFDTYKVGTVANSCSTMHMIHAKEFTEEDFSTDKLCGGFADSKKGHYANITLLFRNIIDALNLARDLYLETEDAELKKIYWWQMIQLLPSSYNQRRTIMLNYEVLANIYRSRKDHKLDEWRNFCNWIEKGLPYSEIITYPRNEELYTKAMDAFKSYSGQGNSSNETRKE